ncbi:MAG: hypothetical protein RL591_1316 [Planctomycetota bacterium]
MIFATKHSTFDRTRAACCFIALSSTALLATSPAFALPQAENAELAAALAPTVLTVDAPIDAVTLYSDAAQVTRRIELPPGVGTFELRVSGMPSILEEYMSARVEGARLLDVRYESVVTAVDASTNPELRETLAQLEGARRTSELLALRLAKLNDQNVLLNSIAQKTATESARDFGSKSLDPEALAKQVAFLDEAREKLIAESMRLNQEARENKAQVAALEARAKSIGGRSRTERTAVVTVGKSAAGAGVAWLSYRVTDAGWTPVYTVRATDVGDDAADALSIEFDARVTQTTGEDWKNVTLTLSTAEPSSLPYPPRVPTKAFEIVPPRNLTRDAKDAAGMDLDGAVANRADPRPAGEPAAGKPGMPGRPGGGGGGGFGGGGSEGLTGGIIGDPGEDVNRLGVELEAAYEESEESGSAFATYVVQRRVTIPSDQSRETTQRVAAFTLKPEFSYVARPVVTPLVYLKGKARNDSGFRILAGEARLFVGDDSVGTAEIPAIPEGAEATFWFGADARVTARRTLVSDETKDDGLFTKSDVTTTRWRVDLSSSLAHATSIVVEDSIPVSRSEPLKFELRDLSAPLSTDADYLKYDRPEGVLRWTVALPGITKDGKPGTAQLAWTARRVVPKGTEIREVDPFRP